MTVEAAAPDVLTILRPLAASYTRRAGPGALSTVAPAHISASPLSSSLEPVAALAVLRIDPKGRVSWPRRLGVPGYMVSVRSLDSASIELTVTSRGPGRLIDCRGRVVIPSGVLRAIAAGADDRLLVVALDEGRYALSVVGRTATVA